jgi:hypothetical protein
MLNAEFEKGRFYACLVSSAVVVESSMVSEVQTVYEGKGVAGAAPKCMI